MTSLLIRNVDEALHAQLKRRARLRQRSMDEEVRETLRLAIARDACAPVGENLMDIAARYFGPENGVDLDLPARSQDLERPPPDFSGPEYNR